MPQDQGASARADRAATPSEPSQSSVVSGTAGIPCAFTPGPWALVKQWVRGPGDNGSIARVVEYVGDFRAEGEANARLIAAAPELFEALDRAKDQMSAARSEIRRLRKEAGLPEQEPGGLNVAVYEAKTALAKARGQ